MVSKSCRSRSSSRSKNLGFCYEKGRGVVQDFKQAVKWYQKAAEQGIAFAQCNLGICCAKGQGVAQNVKEAMKWYQKAAEQGNVNAQIALKKMSLAST